MIKYLSLIILFLQFKELKAQVVGTPYITKINIFNQGAPPVVLSPYTGRYWMTYNLDALRAANDSLDQPAFGGLFQWGRAMDGHQKRNSDTTYTKLASINEISNKFIVASSDVNDFYRYFPFSSVAIDFKTKNNKPTLWQPALETVNNPCPKGFRIPTLQEFLDELQIGTINEVNTPEKAFNHFLKIPKTNQQRPLEGITRSLSGVDYFCYFWTATLTYDETKGAYYPNAVALSKTGNPPTAIVFDKPVLGNNLRCIKGLGGEN